MPKAIAFSRYGDPDVLHQIEIPEPRAAAGELVVAVKAAGIQPFDAAFRRGAFAQRSPAQFPQRLGNEFAGLVTSVGPRQSSAAATFNAGDEVIGYTNNAAYSERVVVPAEQVVIKPGNMPWAEAGALSASGQTAASALEQLAIKPGETLLIHAAAGGVGSVAVQLAVLQGVRVIGTASQRNHEYLRSLGAEPVQYGEGLVERVRGLAPKGVDAVLDCIGGEAITASAAIGVDPARIGTTTDFMAAMAHKAKWLSTERSAAKLARLAKLWADGQLRLSISKTFPLAEAAAAHREVETGHVRGKVVLLMS